MLLASTATGQVSFTASTDARQVLQNGVFTVKFTLQNADGRDFQAPAFEGFEVISGPSMSMSTTIVNGRRSQARAYAYTLLASDIGKFVIPAARIRVGSQIMTTESVEIEVVKGREGVAGATLPSDDEVFIRLEMDTSNIYPGQQVRLDYLLYTTVTVRNYNTLKEDDYEDFYFRYVREFDERAGIEVIDGVQYRVQPFKSLALFPQRTGAFDIEPLMINAGIAVKDQRRSFLFNTRTVPRALTSNPLSFEVSPFPDPQPDQFTGAVGNYQMAMRVNRQELTTDDALVLTVQLTGQGDAKRWTPPTLDYLANRFEIYDPKVLQDNSKDENGVIINRKVIEYLLIPKEAGTTQIRVNFVYFDPDSVQYRYLSSDPIKLTVREGTNSNGPALISDQFQQKELQEIISPAREPGSSHGRLFSPFFFAMTLLPFLGLGFAWIRKQKTDAFYGLDPAERKKRLAMRTALSHLEDAKQKIGGDDRVFFEAISTALYNYVSSKLKISASEISKENVEKRMAGAGIGDTHRQQAMEIIQHSEMVLYAGGTAVREHQGTYVKTLELITEMERVFN